jgi:hypothetical protein
LRVKNIDQNPCHARGWWIKAKKHFNLQKKMAALSPDSIVSTTVEDALLKMVRRIADLQTSQTTNPQNRTTVTQFTQNALTGAYTVALTIPSTITLGPSGVTSNATEVFVWLRLLMINIAAQRQQYLSLSGDDAS